MSRPSGFQRKVIYLAGIVVLFACMYVVQNELVTPARHEYKLTEETLGEVDETGFAINLVLAGFRGIAANLLWSQVHQMQREHDWEGLKAIYNSIATLQPHFITVWIYQAWNLAWNISVEWDDPRDKYYWIIEGYKFLRRGQAQNQSDPDIWWQMGWIFFWKIGKSDEADLFRRYWKEDAQLNPHGDDNFLVAYHYFTKAVDLVVSENRNPKTMGNAPFAAYPAHAKVAYAEHMERDGTFKEPAREFWRDALQEFENLRKTLDLGEPGSRTYAQEQRVRIINFDNWVRRCQAEIDLVDAREQFALGRRADEQADFPRALEHYRQSLAIWREAMKKHAKFFEDEAALELPRFIEQRIQELQRQIS